MLRRYFFIGVFVGAGASGLGAATFTSTRTFTLTPSPTVTATATPTSSATSFAITTLTPTPFPTAPVSETATRTATMTASQTPWLPISNTVTQSGSPTNTFYLTVNATLTPSATVSSTPAPTPMLSPVPSAIIDDFDDGDFIGYSGGTTSSQADPFGSSISLTLVAGSTSSGSAYAAHCAGTVIATGGSSTPWAILRCEFLPGGTWTYLPPIAPDHAITFSFKSDFVGVPIECGLWTSGTDHYSYTFSPTDTSWHEMTVYFPDVNDPSLVPRLVPSAGAAAWSAAVFDIRNLSFSVVPQAGGPQTFGFAVDDLRFGEPRSQSSLVQLATALGVSIPTVSEAYSFYLDEQLTWIVMRLAAHCGCTARQIMTMRETRSWGQVALDVGTTWSAVLAEVNSAGLAPPNIDPTGIERGLLNGVLPTPGFRTQWYLPSGDYVLPTPVGVCP